jgi:hypothetical protein
MRGIFFFINSSSCSRIIYRIVIDGLQLRVKVLQDLLGEGFNKFEYKLIIGGFTLPTGS